MRKIATLFFCLLILWSCKQEDISITHLPFKVDADDRWGLIGTDGKILFENEFENQPSFVVNGIFFVQNADGLYEYYTADKKPKRIGNKSYVNAGYFIEDVAPVTESERHISFISRDGSTAFTLDSYKGEEILEVSSFSSGRAAFKLKSGKKGFIDKKGQVVITPQFSEVGYFSEGLAVVWASDSTTYVINTNGDKQFDLRAKRDKEGNIPTFGQFKDGLLPVGNEVPESDIHRIVYYLNTKGDRAFNVPSKVLVNTDFKDGYALCSNTAEESTYGVINNKGEIVIRPKYASEDLYGEYGYGGFAAKGFVCLADKGKYGLIDLKDNVICPFQFDEIFPFYNNKYAFAKERDLYHLIDNKGNSADKKEYALVVKYTDTELAGSIKSDYLDIKNAVKLFFEHSDGKHVEQLALDETLEQVLKKYTIGPDKKSLNGQYVLYLNGVDKPDYSTTYQACFNAPVVRSTTTWDWPLSRTVEYKYNMDAKINVIIVHIDFHLWINDQANRIDKAIKDYLKSIGYKHVTSGTWNDLAVDLFKKSDDLTTITLAKSESLRGSYRIILGLNNN